MKWEDSGGTSFEQAPVGTHLAKCVSVVDIGTQKGEYQGQVNYRRQNIITWELPKKLREDGQPFIISKFYTASIGEKANLRRDLINWFGTPPKAPFDPAQLLGKACQVIVSERENSDKRVVSGLASLPDGVELPEGTHNKQFFFDLDNFDEELFNNLGDGLKKMIEKSPEYAKVINGESDEEVSEEEIPF